MIEIETDDEDEPPKKRRRIVRLPTGEILPPTTYDEIDSETEMIMPGHRKSISAKHVRRKILPFFIQQLINIVLIMPFFSCARFRPVDEAPSNRVLVARAAKDSKP